MIGLSGVYKGGGVRETGNPFHLLNECGANSSGIYDQGLVNFFLDDLFAYDAVIAIATQALQDRLDTALNGATVARLHSPKYSMIAYPFSTRYQNPNQWVSEILAAAQAGGTVTREAAQEYLKDRGYTPDIVRISGFKRFGAVLFRANVQFDDHPDSESESDRYSFVSVRSILRYLERTGGMKTRTQIISQN